MSAVNHHHLAEQTIRSWFSNMSSSVRGRDMVQHLKYVSRKISVYGMPSKAVITFKEWKARRQKELLTEELLALNYQGIRIISSSPKRISFNTSETLVGKDGKMVIMDKNIIIENEDDGNWRVVEESVNKWHVKKLNLKKF
jgi:hypothetical protein